MTNNIAIIVPADSDTAIVNPFTVGESYQWLSVAVEGMISCVSLKHGIDMWVNDEYLYNGSEFNSYATALYWDTYGFMSHQVYGNVVFAASEYGDTVGLTKEQFDYLGPILDEFGILLDLSLLA